MAKLSQAKIKRIGSTVLLALALFYLVATGHGGEVAQSVMEDLLVQGSPTLDGAPMVESGAGDGAISDPDRQAIVKRAYEWVGNAEYAWGACEPGRFDCSGFVSYCLIGTYSRVGTTQTFMGWPETDDPSPATFASAVAIVASTSATAK